MTKTILHLPSWYPNKLSSISGIFTEKMINAINNYSENEFKHVVFVWHNSEYATFKKPLKYIKILFSCIF
jgi:hypothetical protein